MNFAWRQRSRSGGACGRSPVRDGRYGRGGMDEAERIAQFRQRHGLDSLIDVHTHFMPANVLDKVWKYFDAAGPLVGRPWPITYRHDEDERVATLRSFGVARFTSMLYPHRPEMAAWLNACPRSSPLAHPTACTRPRSTRSRVPRTMWPQRSPPRPRVQIAHPGRRLRPQRPPCSTRCGPCSPTPACRRSSTADPARRREPTPVRNRWSPCWNASPNSR